MRFRGSAARQSLSQAKGVLLGSLLLVVLLVMFLDTLLAGGSLFAVLLTSLVFLSTASVYTLRLYFHHPNVVNLWTIFFLFYIVVFAAGGILGMQENVLYTASRVHVSLALQAFSLLAIGLIASLVGYQWLDRGSFGAKEKAAICFRIRQLRLSVLIGLLGILWSLRGYAASQGLVIAWTGGNVMASADAWTLPLIQLSQLMRPATIFLGAVLFTDEQVSRRWRGAVVLVGEFAYAFLLGRRLLLEALVIMILVSLWAGKRPRVNRAVSWAAAIGVIAFVAWPFMFHVRMMARQAGLYSADPGERFHILREDVIPYALTTFSLDQTFEETSPYVENVHQRSRNIDFLVEIQAAHQSGVGFMWGHGIATALVSSIPQAIWPGKKKFLEGDTSHVEQLIESHFGLPLTDQGSTVVTQGYADGGVVGVILYMTMMGMALALCERWVHRCHSTLCGIWVYALGTSLAVQTETEFTSLLAVGRMIIALLILDWLYGKQIERWLVGARKPSGQPP
jgi:hypothetical protein